MSQSAAPTELLRPTYAEINLQALAHNYDELTKLLPGEVRLLAMVKADAYGHGAVPVSRRLAECGVAGLGVATVEEGLELRGAGLTLPILVLGGLLGMGLPAGKVMIEADLTPVIHSPQIVSSLEEEARRAKKKIAVHIKIDTGMSRLGLRAESIPSLVTHLKACQWLAVQGVMTHFASADDEAATRTQADVFGAAARELERGLGKIPIWHMANSTALLAARHIVQGNGERQWWVRPGLALYGVGGSGGPSLQPVMRLLSHIALTKWIPIGTKVSYAGIFTAMQKTRIAVIPIGYADGYPWSLSGKAFVLVRGRRVPVVGRITMDMIMLDVTDIPEASVGDEVVLLGRQGEKEITVSEFASWAGTIAYEILCGVSKRTPRFYV